jgi:hypothetical protein
MLACKANQCEGVAKDKTCVGLLQAYPYFIGNERRSPFEIDRSGTINAEKYFCLLFYFVFFFLFLSPFFSFLYFLSPNKPRLRADPSSAPKINALTVNFVTTALPTPIAPFHLGHFMEYISFRYLRFQRLRVGATKFTLSG